MGVHCDTLHGIIETVRYTANMMGVLSSLWESGKKIFFFKKWSNAGFERGFKDTNRVKSLSKKTRQ